MGGARARVCVLTAVEGWGGIGKIRPTSGRGN